MMSNKTANARERILLAAIELFSTQDIRATGVDSIVKSANINKMSLYKHFSSKEALIVAYLQNHDAEWLVSPDFQGCPFIKASSEFPDQSHAVHQVSAAFYRKFRSYMTDLAGQAGARFPERLAGQLCALFEGTIVSEQLQRKSGTTDDAKLAAVLLIENGIE
jgi:AcrR family transcriptional regulator